MILTGLWHYINHLLSYSLNTAKIDRGQSTAMRSVTLNLANKFSQCTLALLNTMTYLAA